ncbi:MAG: hypothetical protein WC386_03020 [Candidatus Paceibacterota bacterium]|jgi:hypothetical protein
MKKIILTQFFVLLAGTLFAWYNFAVEWIAYSQNTSCTIGCAAGTSPFLTPCFGGAIFFTIAFVLHLIILRKTCAGH